MIKKNITFLIAAFLIHFSSISQNEILPTSTEPLSIGETTSFHSVILDEDRVLNIYLPYGYSKDSIKEYPVIYLLDGTIDEDFLHISGLVQFGSFSWINFIPESIVVGISNVDRKRDYTFLTSNEQDKKDFPTTGGSENFIQFIEQELQPFVTSQYKTNGLKTIIGQSLGGLLATEILINKPDLFDNYIIISPSIWWDDESIMKLTPKVFTSKKNIYIGVGKEGKVMERTAEELYYKMKPIVNKDSRVFYEYFEQQDHGDVLHLAAYNAFTLVFEPSK